MNPFPISNVLRLCLVAFAVVTACIVASFNAPVPVAIGAALIIAAVAAAPREVGAYILVVFGEVNRMLASSFLNLGQLCLLCARRLSPETLRRLDFGEPLGKPLGAELSIGHRRIAVTAINFDLTAGTLVELTRQIFVRCTEFDRTEPVDETRYEPATLSELEDDADLAENQERLGESPRTYRPPLSDSNIKMSA